LQTRGGFSDGRFERCKTGLLFPLAEELRAGFPTDLERDL
jgi:hypothetical protein